MAWPIRSQDRQELAEGSGRVLHLPGRSRRDVRVGPRRSHRISPRRQPRHPGKGPHRERQRSTRPGQRQLRHPQSDRQSRAQDSVLRPDDQRRGQYAFRPPAQGRFHRAHAQEPIARLARFCGQRGSRPGFPTGARQPGPLPPMDEIRHLNGRNDLRAAGDRAGRRGRDSLPGSDLQWPASCGRRGRRCGRRLRLYRGA